MSEPETEVRRTVAPTEPEELAERSEGPEVHTLAVERTYPADTTDLWAAVSEPERIARWFLPVSGDLRRGGRYQLEGNAGGTIETCDPPRSYSVTWEIGDDVSHVRVVVTDEAGGATLRIEQDSAGGEHWERYGPAATGLGWEGALRGLGKHLSTGAALDPETEMAWAASPDGLAFLCVAGAAWAEVTAAAGYDATWARDAAARTVAAYSGEAG